MMWNRTCINISKPLSENMNSQLRIFLRQNAILDKNGDWFFRVIPSRGFRLPAPLARYVQRVNSVRRSVKPRHIVYATAGTAVTAGATITFAIGGLAVSGAYNGMFAAPGEFTREKRAVEERYTDTLPTEYDLVAIQTYWRARPVEVIQRTLECSKVLVPYFTRLFLWEYAIRRKIRNHDGLQRKYAKEFREKLVQLGPCFIKLGQALSIRPDVMPQAFLDELQKLCDAVPSFPTQDAISVINEELGPGAAERMFHDLKPDTQPIAAASLGQVYKLRLRDAVLDDDDKNFSKGEKWVAVKVQRPDMIRCILKDLFILRTIAGAIEKIKTTVTKQRPFDVSLVDTFAAASLGELNYVKEAENQEKFIAEVVPRLKGQVYVPKVYNKFTSRKVIVTEWIEGEKLASSAPDVINRLTKVGIECFLCQLLEVGFFHSDPHPGNLLINQKGQLVLIDFGLCADVPLPDTRTMTLAIVHLMQGDVPELLNDAVELGFLPKDLDMTELKDVLGRVFKSAQIVDLASSTYPFANKNSEKYTSIASRRKKFWAVSNDLNKIFFDYPFLVPNYFALITRAMIVLEGIAVTGDPDFDLFSSSYPYAFKTAINVFGVKNLTEIAKEVVKARLNQTQ